MATDHREQLKAIRTFPSLVKYLRDELDWPITTDDFDDATFDYTPEELGIDFANAAKIEEIRRLRPLTALQPWGIFFVKFEPKRLPVVALRRILSSVVVKKRASANSAERAAWETDDLLFISNYGDGEQRQISFAHFSQAGQKSELPTLKVLGWDNLDTPLHLDHIADVLQEQLHWPDDPEDAERWREAWSAAFTLMHREVITTSQTLAIRLAALARAIRDRIITVLDVETDEGPIRTLMKAFQEVLIHDLGEGEFADMYAQTVAYGLLSTRIADPNKRTRDDFTTHMRTNPFLKELMQMFLRVGGHRGKAGGPSIDYDELGISEVIDLLDHANMEAVVRDFGDRNPQEDPVIHFYEDFLAAYDKKQKVSRGVFYTPRPVVSYIVRSVDELLRTEFDLEDGLADTTTWGEMAKRHKDLKLPKGTSPDQAFVQILDPACGTGTFLVEVIDLIHKTMLDKWKSLGHSIDRSQKLWNEYVPKDLLPRLHGYELLMAPYAIAHLKIGLKLYENGYGFESDERARIYLTNALEPASDFSGQFELMVPALAHEAHAVNQIKQKQRFTVIIGNPPYLGEAGPGGDWITGLMRGYDSESEQKTASYFEVDGKPLNERNSKWLNDLYVQFTRLSQQSLEMSGCGVHGFITNHGYLDNPTFRGMRWSLMTAFDEILALDLHGNLKKREAPPEGGKDANVFDIEQGVGIGIFVKKRSTALDVADAEVRHADVWGERSFKYEWLIKHSVTQTEWTELTPFEPFFLFRPFDGERFAEYSNWAAINRVMPVNGVGIVTARDHMVIDFETAPLLERATFFRDSVQSDEETCAALGIPLKKGWDYARARQQLRSESDLTKFLADILYRPFDERRIFYHEALVWRVVEKVMSHMLAGENYAIVTARSNKFPEPNHFFTSRTIVETKCGEASTQSATFPLYLYPGVGNPDLSILDTSSAGNGGRRANLDLEYVDSIERATGLTFISDGQGDLVESFGPEDVLAYIYVIFHSREYRQRYAAFLKLDFPRVPLPGGLRIFAECVRLGRELLPLHWLESPKLDSLDTSYTGPSNPEVGRVGWSNDTVWLDAAKTTAREGHHATVPGTIGIQGVSEEVWNFHIGGYQVCHKWLKDRKGRMLSGDDMDRYRKIIHSLSETVRIMDEIDEVIDQHGGWPHAFTA